MTSNDEVERRAGAPTPNKDALSQSSTPSFAHRSCSPRDRSNRLLDARAELKRGATPALCKTHRRRRNKPYSSPAPGEGLIDIANAPKPTAKSAITAGIIERSCHATNRKPRPPTMNAAPAILVSHIISNMNLREVPEKNVARRRCQGMFGI
jgi:hypothetical protein